jgi:hypothetical protein
LIKAVLDSSVIIATSYVDLIDNLNKLFCEILIPQAVYEEVCLKGKGLIGDEALRAAISCGNFKLSRPQDRKLVEALIEPLGKGEAESLALAIEEEADLLVVDDRLARRKARNMEIPIVGTLRILKMMFDSGIIDSARFIESIQTLSEIGFRVSDVVIKNITDELTQ